MEERERVPDAARTRGRPAGRARPQQPPVHLGRGAHGPHPQLLDRRRPRPLPARPRRRGPVLARLRRVRIAGRARGARARAGAAGVGRHLRRADARAVRLARLLVRLVAHVHELRRGHLPLVAVAVPGAARGWLHLRARGLDRLVRQLPDGARPRADRGRPVLALSRAGAARPALAVVRPRQRLRRGERPPPRRPDRLEQGRDRRAALRARPRRRRGAGRKDAGRHGAQPCSHPTSTPWRRPSSRSSPPTTRRSSSGLRRRACASSSTSSATPAGSARIASSKK